MPFSGRSGRLAVGLWLLMLSMHVQPLSQPRTSIDEKVADILQLDEYSQQAFVQPQLQRASMGSNKLFGLALCSSDHLLLEVALQQLGYKIIMHDRLINYFMYNQNPSSTPAGSVLDVAEELGKRYGRREALASLDIPVSLYYKELLAAFPAAKFVLMVEQDTSKWFQRERLELKNLRKVFHGLLPFRVRHLLDFALGSSNENRELWMQYYEEHNRNVIKHIPEAQLLVLRDVDGSRFDWAQLCGFLQRTDGACASVVPRPLPVPEIPELTTRHLHRLTYTNMQLGNLGVQRSSRFAYVTLLANPSDGAARLYLTQAVVAAESIRLVGSKEDIVFLVLGNITASDTAMLETEHIKVVRVGWIEDAALPKNVEKFSEASAQIFRAKIRVLQLYEYEMVLFFDSDVLLHANPEKLFRSRREFTGFQGLYP